MSDWKFLNEHRVKNGEYSTEDKDGFCGAFMFRMNGLLVCVICSEGEGWQHVSVSLYKSSFVPSWEIMCKVKDLFWEPDDWVCQFHPAHKEYINNHPGVLHLWKPLKEKLPTPPQWMVGFKELNYERRQEKSLGEAVRDGAA